MDGLFKGKTVTGQAWCDEYGHALGIVVREKVDLNERKVWVTRLYKFRNAVMGEGQGKVDAVIEGSAPEIICNIPGCQAGRPWIIGESAMERLLQHRPTATEAVSDPSNF
jgi:hypothetical protein